MIIQSHKGPYSVTFEDGAMSRMRSALPAQGVHFIIDARVAKLYAEPLKDVLSSPSVLLVEAAEPNKSLDKFTAYVEHLVANGVRRDHVLVAIGGGIIQDIACFLAATLLRGVDWYFYPTTLLAQADSCIGSKSSINVGDSKNLLGTFTPPKRIWIDTGFLKTLDDRDMRSGVGEMLKVHAIEGPDSFARIVADYDRIFSDKTVLMHYIYRSLEIKKRVIEADEFDRGLRNIMNYGHTFGHAIESATNFAVPHGIAVTIGMDMANFVASRLGLSDLGYYQSRHPILAKNYRGFTDLNLPLPAFFKAIAKDKKNTTAKISLILPDAQGKIQRGLYDNDAKFQTACENYFREEFAI